jgi:two-component system cell cycle response regulator DivK
MANELILIVEDNAMNMLLVADSMRLAGYRVEEATTAEDALEFVEATLPDLVLMDIELPGIDGVEALRRLKSDPRTASIPVVAVTASVMPIERTEILRAGFDGYHSKPITVRELVSDVRALLDARDVDAEGPRNS